MRPKTPPKAVSESPSPVRKKKSKKAVKEKKQKKEKKR